MSNKRRKARQKRWLANREKTQKKAKFAEGFRNWFVKKGVIKG